MLPQDGIVGFDEVFSLPCTLYRKAEGESGSSSGAANFEEKHYEVKLHRIQGTAGEISTDLAANTGNSANGDAGPWLVATGKIDVAAATAQSHANEPSSSNAPTANGQHSSTNISAQFSSGPLGLAFARHNTQRGARNRPLGAAWRISGS